MKINKMILSAALASTVFFSSGAFSSIEGKYQCTFPEGLGYINSKNPIGESIITHVSGNNYTSDWKINEGNKLLSSGHSSWVVIGDKVLSQWSKAAFKNKDRLKGVAELSIKGNVISGDVISWLIMKNDIKRFKNTVICHKM